MIPAVAFIEMALDKMKEYPRDDSRLASEVHEFRMLGQGRLVTLRASGDFDHYTDLQLGYLIGIETARVLLQTMPAAAAAGVKI